MALPAYATSRLGLLQLRINIALACGFALLATAILAPHQHLLGRNASFIWTGILSVVGWRLMSGIQRLLDGFVPENALEAKRLNEQIKLMATMLNTVAAAAVSVLAIAEIAKQPQQPNMTLIACAIGLGIWVQMGARGLLLHLKDESPTAYETATAEAGKAGG